MKIFPPKFLNDRESEIYRRIAKLMQSEGVYCDAVLDDLVRYSMAQSRLEAEYADMDAGTLSTMMRTTQKLYAELGLGHKAAAIRSGSTVHRGGRPRKGTGKVIAGSDSKWAKLGVV